MTYTNSSCNDRNYTIIIIIIITEGKRFRVTEFSFLSVCYIRRILSVVEQY